VDVVRERFFAVHILASIQGGDGDDGVPVIRRGDDDGVDVLAGEELAEVAVGLAAFEGGVLVLAVALGDGLLGVLTAVGIDIADGDDLDFFATEEVVEVTAVHLAVADEAEREALAGGSFSAPNA
jgi:hypothetical protein